MKAKEIITRLEELENIVPNGVEATFIWKVEDFLNDYPNCTDEEAQEILNKALQNDNVMESIWHAIDFTIEEKELQEM